MPALRHVEGPTPANLMKLTDSNRKILNARIATKVTNPPEYKLTAITAFSQHTWDATSLPAIDDTK